MSVSPATTPACPITGQPAVRRLQSISSALLIGLWRASFGVAAARQLGEVSQFGLWESPCGLIFFDPMIAGDAIFYKDLYLHWGKEGPWSDGALERADFSHAAALIKPGDKVLDIGCGSGAFAGHVGHATYVGLDDNYSGAGVQRDIRNESLAAHAAGHPAQYDAVCSFHVVEHVPNPAQFVLDMQRCVRPGGYLILAVPKFPSAWNDIPNFVLNAPPHHLTWWNEQALRTLADTAGLDVESIRGLPLTAHHRLPHWMGRCAPKLTGERYFRHAIAWHGALIWSRLAGGLLSALYGAPANAKAIELLLIARRPQAPTGELSRSQ
jgi:SAM-dependent methyltransferase